MHSTLRKKARYLMARERDPSFGRLERARYTCSLTRYAFPLVDAYTLSRARGLQQVHRALYSPASTVEDVGVNHGGLHALMTEELRHSPDVVAVHQQVGGEESAVGCGRSRASRCRPPGQLGGRPSGCSAHTGDAAALSRPGISRQGRRREHILPAPLRRSPGYFRDSAPSAG